MGSLRLQSLFAIMPCFSPQQNTVLSNTLQCTKAQMHPEDALVSSNLKKLSLGISMTHIRKVHVQLTLDRSHNYDIVETHPY